MFGRNCKVHFAGSDGQENFYAALNAADVNYRLYSCYKYIVSKKPDSDFRLPDNHVIKAQCKEQKHTIQDSGFFSLLYGAKRVENISFDYTKQWQDKLIEFVRQNELNCTIIEVDCQRVLGVEEAWYFRERMKQLLPNNRQINVWHLPDGKKGLDRLIEFSDYIALGPYEWRRAGRTDYKSEDVKYVTHYIKNKKPEIDIHLLGCTDAKILRENSFVTSTDSTSWLQGVQYGSIDDGIQKKHIRNFRKDLFDERQERVLQELQRRGAAGKSGSLKYATNASLCATICKNRYSLLAGPQD